LIFLFICGAGADRSILKRLVGSALIGGGVCVRLRLLPTISLLSQVRSGQSTG